MRHFLVCKKGRGTRRELLGLYIVSDKAQLLAEVRKTERPESCLVLEARSSWGIVLTGRINPNQKKAFVQGAYFCSEALAEASDLASWREFSEIS